MKTINKVRRNLYRGARILGDVNSLSSPEKFVKRQARKSIWRWLFRLLK